MPRRKNADDGATTPGGQPVPKQPRARKKREPTAKPAQQQQAQAAAMYGAPDGMGGMKMEMGGPGGMLGCHPQQPGGSMDGGGPPPGMGHMGLPNGTMEDGPGLGMAPPYGPGPTPNQGAPPPDFFYQQGPPPGSGPPPNFGPPPQMFGGGPPPQQMMLQQASTAAAMGQGQPPPGMGGQYQQQQQEAAEQQHHQQQMMSPMHAHPHHHPALAAQQSGARPGPPPMASAAGPHPGMPPLPPPPHQSLPPPMFAAGFPRPQPPGPFLMFPPTIPQPPFLEYRLQEMNRRLYQFHSQFHQSSPENHEQWWEAFAQEFFDEGARMSMSIPEFLPEQGGHVKREFTVVRALIPRFYRSLFDHGVSQLHYAMRAPVQEMVDPHRFQNPELFGGCALNCENLLMITMHSKPMHTEVHTDCRLYIEFAPFHPTVGYRIRHWFLDIRGSQEFYNMKDGSNGMDGNSQQELARKSVLTTFGLPSQTMRELKMMQILQPMKPIMDRAKENNETPQMAMQSIVMERMEMEQRQRSAAAAAAAHIQTPPHHPHHQGPGSVPSGSGMIGGAGMAHHQMVGMPIGPGPAGMGGPSGSGAPAPAEETKPKPKRQRQRKTTANAAAGGGGNTSPPKGKKGTAAAAAAAAAAAGQQTPPIGGGGPPGMMGGGGGPMRGFMGGGAPGQFHPLGGMPPPPGAPGGQFHPDHQVLTVGEPSMMGCEYGGQDERQISRVENRAFIGGGGGGDPGGGGGMMGGPQGGMVPISSAPGPSSMMPGGMQQQQQMVDSNGQHLLRGADFVDQHMQHLHQQQQQQHAPWSFGPPPSNNVGGGDSLGMPQAMSGGT